MQDTVLDVGRKSNGFWWNRGRNNGKVAQQVWPAFVPLGSHLLPPALQTFDRSERLPETRPSFIKLRAVASDRTWDFSAFPKRHVEWQLLSGAHIQRLPDGTPRSARWRVLDPTGPG